MSQYCSRLHIKVSSPNVWKKFEDEDDANFNLAQLAEKNCTSYIIDDEWSSDEDELKGVVKALARTLGSDGIIIADTTNINVDPYNYCIFYLGDRVRTKEVDEEECEMHFETEITNIPEWLSYGRFYVSTNEKEQLFRCGIASVNGRFEAFSTNFNLPTKIYLRETSFEKRPDHIEEAFVGEKVYFVHAKSPYDPLRLEVMSDLGSLGYLPSDISDAIAPAFLNKRLTYTAKIVEIVKLSKRNKHAKSPFIAINIEAEVKKFETKQNTGIPSRQDKDRLYIKVKFESGKVYSYFSEYPVKVGDIVYVPGKMDGFPGTVVEIIDKQPSKVAESYTLYVISVKEKVEAEEKAKIEDEKKRRDLEQETLKQKYEQDYAIWEKLCSDIKTKRTEEVSKRLSVQKSSLENAAKQKRDIAIKTAHDKKLDYTKHKIEAEKILGSLGFFKFSEKKTQTINIETARIKISEAEEEIRTAETTYNIEISEIASKVSVMEEQIIKEVEKDIPLPAEPKSPS